MSRYCGRVPGVFDWECPEDGLYECNDIISYFQDPNRLAFYIKVGEEKAGFILLNKVGTRPDVDWNIGEFFVLAKFQSSGIGQQIAKQLFEKFPGIWEVAAMLENTGAYQFWHKVIERYTDGSFTEKQTTMQEPEPHPMLVFRFVSPSIRKH